MSQLKFIVLLLVASTIPSNEDFKKHQLNQERVKLAHLEKAQVLDALLSEKKLQKERLQIYFRTFKKENMLEIWATDDTHTNYQLLKSYPFCFASGLLGPKKKQGDYQVPEGFYHIDRFNPWSRYHLSLGINYPNDADKRKAEKSTKLGGDIFIHGRCSSIGCLAMNDDQIKEIYLLALEARCAGQQKIPVHLFPACMDAENLPMLQKTADNNKVLLSFWESLQPAYNYFERYKQVPVMHIDEVGNYILLK